MKNLSVSCLMILLLTLTFISGCKKDNPQDIPVSKDYAGNYSFTFTDTSYPDSIFHYDGSVYFNKTSKTLTVNYFKEIYNPYYPYAIYPTADDKGVMSYPDWSKNGYFFDGNIDYDGNISFQMGLRIIHWGQTIEQSRTVTGKKK